MPCFQKSVHSGVSIATIGRTGRIAEAMNPRNRLREWMVNNKASLASVFKSALGIASILLVSANLLDGCGQSSQNSDKLKKEQAKSKQTADMAEDDFDGADGTTESAVKKKGLAKAAKPKLSVDGKKTGKLLDGIVLHQQNEFLGTTLVKLSKMGARLESSTITIIMIPGKKPVAYNAQNGSTMQ